MCFSVYILHTKCVGLFSFTLFWRFTFVTCCTGAMSAAPHSCFHVLGFRAKSLPKPWLCGEQPPSQCCSPRGENEEILHQGSAAIALLSHAPRRAAAARCFAGSDPSAVPAVCVCTLSFNTYYHPSSWQIRAKARDVVLTQTSL